MHMGSFDVTLKWEQSGSSLNLGGRTTVIYLRKLIDKKEEVFTDKITSK